MRKFENSLEGMQQAGNVSVLEIQRRGRMRMLPWRIDRIIIYLLL